MKSAMVVKLYAVKFLGEDYCFLNALSHGILMEGCRLRVGTAKLVYKSGLQQLTAGDL